MRTTVLIAVLAAGCTGELDESTTTVEQENRCPPDVCSSNSGEVARNGMWEANLYGEPDVNKISLQTRPPTKTDWRRRAQIWDAFGRPYDLYVKNGFISGINPTTGRKISGASLIGAKLHVLQSGQPLYHIRIDNVRWIKTPVGAPDLIEVYKMVWVPQQASLGEGTLCDMNDYKWDDIKDADQLQGMRSNETLVFEGDRIDRDTLTMNKNEGWDPSWFNFGCAGRTLAKLRMTRKTQGNGTGDWSARQAALKMLSADYCGTGDTFTRTGTRIGWMDDENLVTYARPPVQLEARWNEHGAYCVDAARLQTAQPHVWDYIWGTCLPTPCFDTLWSTPGFYELAGAKIISAMF